MSVNIPIIIVGAGPAGIGIATLLARCEIPTIILEQGRIGESFHRWPKETRFISPSFTGNFFGSVDLNSITPESSPAYGLQTEHPTGLEYVDYLETIVEIYKLDVREKVTVQDINFKDKNLISLITTEGTMSCNSLIWAGGEFQFPKKLNHTVRVGSSYKNFPKGHHIVIGGGESGVEAAYNLANNGSTVSVIDHDKPWADQISDSSYGLSPYTFDRLRSLKGSKKVELIEDYVEEITTETVTTKKRVFKLEHPAIDATGFDITKSIAGKLFDFKDGYPSLTDCDESTRQKNVFLVGSNVYHETALFCFIYKFRQRFAVVVREILNRMGKNSEVIAEYADKGFLLDDLSCCGDECTC